MLRASNQGSDKWVESELHLGARDVCDGSKELKEKIEGLTGIQVCVCVCVSMYVCAYGWMCVTAVLSLGVDQGRPKGIQVHVSVHI